MEILYRIGYYMVTAYTNNKLNLLLMKLMNMSLKNKKIALLGDFFCFFSCIYQKKAVLLQQISGTPETKL